MSTHSLMSFVLFFAMTTIGTHHSIASVTGAIMSCCRSKSSSSRRLSRYTKEIERGTLTQNGSALSILNSYPSIAVTCLSNTVGKSFISCSAMPA